MADSEEFSLTYLASESLGTFGVQISYAPKTNRTCTIVECIFFTFHKASSFED
jgi:hypothetical protein